MNNSKKSSELKIETIDAILVVDSRLIAAELTIEHESFIKTVKKYEQELLTFGPIRFQIGTVTNSTGAVNQVKYVYLTEDQATFIMTLSRNTVNVVQCKLELVKKFSEAKKLLEKQIPVDPAEAIIQGLQLWRKQQEEIHLLQFEQQKQAVAIEVARVLAEQTSAQVHVHEQKIEQLTAEMQALRAIINQPVPGCAQSARQRLVEGMQLLGVVAFQKGLAASIQEAMKEVWSRLLLKIKHSSSRIDLALRKSNLLKKYEEDMKDYKAGNLKVKPKKKDYNLTYAALIERLGIEQDAYACFVSVTQDLI